MIVGICIKWISKIESTAIIDNLIKAKKWETKKILIDEKNYKDLVIYFTRYDRGRSVRTLSILSWSKSLYYHELMAKIR